MDVFDSLISMLLSHEGEAEDRMPQFYGNELW